jgi:zinc resistance-associated protein
MKKTGLFATLILILAFAPLVMAGPRGIRGGMDQGPGGKGPALAELNLTAEQSEKIRALRESHHREVAPIRNQLFSKRAELRLLWMQTDPDPARIKAMQKEVLDLMGQLHEMKTDYRLGFRKILTPEQLSKFLAQGLERSHGPRGGWKGGRPHHGKDRGPGGCW